MSIAPPLIRIRRSRGRGGIKREIAPPFEIAPEPKALERGNVMGGKRGARQRRIALGRQEVPLPVSLEQQQAVREYAVLGHDVAKAVRHRAEIFTNDRAMLTPTFERDDATEIGKRISDIGPFACRHAA